MNKEERIKRAREIGNWVIDYLKKHYEKEEIYVTKFIREPYILFNASFVKPVCKLEILDIDNRLSISTTDQPGDRYRVEYHLSEESLNLRANDFLHFGCRFFGEYVEKDVEHNVINFPLTKRDCNE